MHDILLIKNFYCEKICKLKKNSTPIAEVGHLHFFHILDDISVNGSEYD